MKATAKKCRTLISVTAAILGMALQASPSAALDEEQGDKLSEICSNKSCQALAELFIPSGISAQAGGVRMTTFEDFHRGGDTRTKGSKGSRS